MSFGDSERVQASWISFITSITLLVLKFWAFVLTQSSSVLSDALESIVNVLAAAMAIVVIRIAVQPADRDHPYGHGKAEYFSATFEGGLITFAGFAILLEVADRWFRGIQIQKLDQGIILLLFAGLANLALGLFLKARAKKLNSLALYASGQHVLADFWTSLAVIIGLAGIQFTKFLWIDLVVAALVALHLIWTGIELVRSSVGGLMDAEDRKLLEKLIPEFSGKLRPGIIYLHHVRMIRSGSYHHIDAHVVVPEFWDVLKSHHETNLYANEVLGGYGADGEIHFHVDPCLRTYCKICPLQDCSIREQKFEHLPDWSVEALISPTDPFEKQTSKH